MIIQKPKHSIAEQDGFTLIELAVVLVIIGFTLSSIALGLDMYNRNLRSDRTLKAVQETQTEIELMAPVQGYPCPADPTLAPGDPMYGQADCSAANANIVSVLSRDTDGNGSPDLEVRIGAVPFKNIADFSENSRLREKRYTENYGLDGWNNKLTYAVTFGLTVPGFDESMGAICIVDENETNLLNEPCTAHAVILSHGPNARGAYARAGNMPGNDCVDVVGLTPAEIANIANDTTPNDRENCDHGLGGPGADARFVKGVYNETEGESYDDTLKFIAFQNNTIWQRGVDLIIPFGNPLDPTDDIRIPRIASVNDGQIAIGLNTPPQAALHLAGDIQANQVRSELLCDTSGRPEYCLDPELIGGDLPDMQCPPGQVVQQIGRVNSTDLSPGVECVSPFSSASFTQCPPGEVVAGLSSVSGSICVPAP